MSACTLTPPAGRGQAGMRCQPTRAFGFAGVVANTHSLAPSSEVARSGVGHRVSAPWSDPKELGWSAIASR
jgi:hypothetical protein